MILIAEDGEVKVIDFGIAQLHEEERLPHQIIGTPSYMSPEQKENPALVTFASDIFSLGVITYELVLGKLSYGMINLSLLPAGLQKIVGKALSVSQQERYEDVVPFISDLTDYYKSPEIEKDRPGSDQVIEFVELLQKAEQTLSNFEKPHWPQFDLGIAKERKSDQFGLYFDTFKFGNNTKALLIAHTYSSQLISVAHIAAFRGMIKSLIHPYLTTDIPFDLISFVSTLNLLICQDKMEETFYLSILKLIPYNDTLDYISCGPCGPLFHVPQGTQTPRTIHSENPLIGVDPAASFSRAGDTFNDGDLLVFHNLPAPSFETSLQKTLKQNVLLSSNRLSHTLLETASQEKAFAELNHPKALVVLNRIS